MAVYEYEFHNPVPDQFASGFIGSIELYAGKGENLDKIEAKISSGDATFNAHFGASPLPALDIDDFPDEDLIWQIRAEDLGASFSDNDSVDLWYSQPSSSETQSYRQATSTKQPSYYADQDGLGSQSSPNDSPCVYFDGFTQSFDQYGGDAEIPVATSWTLVTAIGKKNAGTYRGVIGTKSSGSIQSLYGDWGRHRVRLESFREYTHGTALLAHDQIRVLTVEYNTDGKFYLNEWINGTQAYGPVNFQYGSNPWNFDMLGSVQYVAAGNTYFLRFSGGISEMWLIKGVVSTTTRQTIEGHVAHKYDSSSILPTTHPYYSTDPNSSVTFINSTDLNLTTSYQTLKSSIGQNLAKNGDLISFYMPKVQQPGTVSIKVTVT